MSSDLLAAEALALSTLTAILKDPASKPTDKRLAACAILRHCAAARSVAERGNRSPGRTRSRRPDAEQPPVSPALARQQRIAAARERLNQSVRDIYAQLAARAAATSDSARSSPNSSSSHHPVTHLSPHPAIQPSADPATHSPPHPAIPP